MKYKYLSMLAIAVSLPLAATAQTAVEALQFTRNDMKGTARFMSMGGAFGALGGDLSALSQNPGGIGIYRSNDIGFTLDLDAQHANATSQGYSLSTNQTKFLLNNIGAVFTLKLNSDACPNINFGFTYNKSASFNRRYAGRIPQLKTSMSNYIAAITNDDGNGLPYTEADMTSTGTFNPYFPNDGGIAAPWISILGYQSYLTTPTYKPSDTDLNDPHWVGQWNQGHTAGYGEFAVEEKGSIDSYNIALGGNISNIVYWGMDFDIINFNYSKSTVWGENLTNAQVEGKDGLELTNSNWRLNNLYQASGTGFNYKLGVIVKPIQELRIGFAFHTPTWYNLTENYTAWTTYRYGNMNGTKEVDANDGVPAQTDFNFRSPWRLVASAATVLGGKFILSFDYEWAGTTGSKFSTPNYNSYDYGYDNGWDWGYDWYYKPASRADSPLDYISNDNSGYAVSNYYIRTTCKATNTFRVGAEYRITDKFSVRAGYSNSSSPVAMEARDGKEVIYTSDLNPSYTFDNSTNYVTCGLGWRTNHFYCDLAYVYKNTSSTFHAFTPDPASSVNVSPSAKLSLNNHQVVLSMGVKF
ncbi:MAG: outer membrane protein transport protein [Muribaculum sp.]|nr:outer membrane protein transport protein [Muribaculum sp.]